MLDVSHVFGVLGVLVLQMLKVPDVLRVFDVLGTLVLEMSEVLKVSGMLRVVGCLRVMRQVDLLHALALDRGRRAGRP
jgi:hypothetical protein